MQGDKGAQLPWDMVCVQHTLMSVKGAIVLLQPTDGHIAAVSQMLLKMFWMCIRDASCCTAMCPCSMCFNALSIMSK